MADKDRKRAKRPSVAASVATVSPDRAVLDSRRVLPTQDWIAKVDRAGLANVANIQILAVSHFYAGLVSLRKDGSGEGKKL